MTSDFWKKREMIRTSSLSTQPKLLLFVLVDYAGDNGAAFPTQATLAADVSLSADHVRRLMRGLRKAEIITATSLGRRNTYRIQWDRIPGASARNQESTPGASARSTPGAGARNQPKTPGAGARQNTKKINTKKEHKEGGKTADAVDPSEIVSAIEVELTDQWNAISGLPTIRSMAKRRKILQSRLRDDGWDRREAIERIPSCPFLMGKNDRGWCASIDWFLRPGSVTKILEGNYDDRNGNGVDHSGLIQFEKGGKDR